MGGTQDNKQTTSISIELLRRMWSEWNAQLEEGLKPDKSIVPPRYEYVDRR